MRKCGIYHKLHEAQDSNLIDDQPEVD